MLDYFDAIRAMYNGKVVKFIGSEIDGVLEKSTVETRMCMFRGVIFVIKDNKYETNTMVYCPFYRYEEDGINVRGTGFWPLTPRTPNNYYTRDGVKTIEDLKPYKLYSKDNAIRYDFHQMVGIINHKLGFDCRHCEQNLVDLGFDIPTNKSGHLEMCDFWLYQIESVFRNKISNGQCNSIYVGTPDMIDFKKFKEEPNDWQRFLLVEWNKMFSHLADKNGWIKIEVWW